MKPRDGEARGKTRTTGSRRTGTSSAKPEPTTPRRAPGEPVATAAARTRAVVIVPLDRSMVPLARTGRAGTKAPDPATPVGRTGEGRLAETVGLAEAIDLDVVEGIVTLLKDRRPATLFTTGKVEEAGALIKTLGADLAIVDHALTPVQQRNLEKAWNVKVIDRTQLILEIFGERANTREGALQVELAHLNWQKSRLVRSWTHLERQRGGFGFLGGPGETQIEADRRLIQERITRLEADLEAVRRTRALHRKQRRRNAQPVVALVGYTNAGKSTLFNRITTADVLAKDLLFATLDPTHRRVTLPHGQEIVLTDTVGFISNLPTHLVASFRATLEEVVEADVILHVRDISHPETEAQAADVRQVLEELGISGHDPSRIIEVHNKIDRLGPEERAAVERRARDMSGEAADAAGEGVGGRPTGRTLAVPVSAVSGAGIDALIAVIETRIGAGRRVETLEIPPEEGELLAWLYRHTEVIERRDEPTVLHLTVRVPESEQAGLEARAGAFITAH